MGSNFGCIRTGVFLMHFCLWFRPCELTTTSSVLSLSSAFMRGCLAFMRGRLPRITGFISKTQRGATVTTSQKSDCDQQTDCYDLCIVMIFQALIAFVIVYGLVISDLIGLTS